MASNIKRIKNGIKLEPSTTAVDELGEMRSDSSDSKIKMSNGTSESPLVTESHNATLTNKTIDGSNNVITGVDADNVVVDPTGNLTSIDVQAALEELQGDIDTVNTNHVNASSGVHGVTGDVVGTTDTQTLSGKTLAQDMLPDANNTRDLGSNATRWADLWLAGNAEIDGDLVVDGDLTVNGTTTTLNTATLDVEDVNISVNVNGNQTSADDSAGLTVEMSDATNVTMIYDKDIPSRWKAGDLGSEIELANISSAQTLTNKTISGASNTLSVRDDDMDSEAATSGQVLTADGAGNASWQDASAAPSASYEMSNLGLAASVAANALTVELKQADGSTDPSGAGEVTLGMRSSTLATGGYTQRTVSSALSVVVSSGSTLGFVDGEAQYVYVYAIDNAGTIELAVSGSRTFDEGLLYSTTAEGGAGAADDKDTLYSTTARVDVPVRYLGRILSNQATAGTWASAPTEVTLHSTAGEMTEDFSEVLLSEGNGHGSTNDRIRRFSTLSIEGAAMSVTQSATDGDSVTINESGVYSIVYADYRAGGSSGFGVSLNSNQLTTSISAITLADRLTNSTIASGELVTTSITRRLNSGDVLRAHTNGAHNTTDDQVVLRIQKLDFKS